MSITKVEVKNIAKKRFFQCVMSLRKTENVIHSESPLEKIPSFLERRG